MAAGRANHAKHRFPEFRSHQAGRRMAAPILGREIGVSLRQRCQGGEQRSGLHEADGFRIPVTQDRVGIGSDTSHRESLVEVRHPRMEPPERRRHAVARAKQTEDSPFGTARFEATREPFGAEILGEDSVDRRVPPPRLRSKGRSARACRSPRRYWTAPCEAFGRMARIPGCTPADTHPRGSRTRHGRNRTPPRNDPADHTEPAPQTIRWTVSCQMLPYVAGLSHAALAVPLGVRRHRWRSRCRDVRMAVLTGIRVPNQSAVQWFTHFAGWTWEPGCFEFGRNAWFLAMPRRSRSGKSWRFFEIMLF